MTSDTHATPNYMAIFWWLLGLTIMSFEKRTCM